MLTALPIARQEHAAHGAVEAEHPDTIETRLWLEEHEWLYGLLRSDDNEPHRVSRRPVGLSQTGLA